MRLLQFNDNSASADVCESDSFFIPTGHLR